MKENPGSFLLTLDHLYNVLLLHQVAILGPSLFQLDQFILALSRVGISATCFCIHLSTFSMPVEENLCPTWGHLKGPQVVQRSEP
jgi:hypothetical protein